MKVSHDSQLPGRDMNPRSLEYEAGLLTRPKTPYVTLPWKWKHYIPAKHW